jgi:hypothetical protein
MKLGKKKTRGSATAPTSANGGRQGLRSEAAATKVLWGDTLDFKCALSEVRIDYGCHFGWKIGNLVQMLETQIHVQDR